MAEIILRSVTKKAQPAQVLTKAYFLIYCCFIITYDFTEGTSR